jgi:hypothetical protein
MLVGLNSDLNAAYRFAEIAGAIMRGPIVGGSHGTGQICVASRQLLFIWASFERQQRSTKSHEQHELRFVSFRGISWIVPFGCG